MHPWVPQKLWSTEKTKKQSKNRKKENMKPKHPTLNYNLPSEKTNTNYSVPLLSTYLFPDEQEFHPTKSNGGEGGNPKTGPKVWQRLVWRL